MVCQKKQGTEQARKTLTRREEEKKDGWGKFQMTGLCQTIEHKGGEKRGRLWGGGECWASSKKGVKKKTFICGVWGGRGDGGKR